MRAYARVYFCIKILVGLYTGWLIFTWRGRFGSEHAQEHVRATNSEVRFSKNDNNSEQRKKVALHPILIVANNNNISFFVEQTSFWRWMDRFPASTSISNVRCFNVGIFVENES